ncbi:MAG: hypothetical protein ABII00_18860 [Elusimicrobiota bacterium]
MLVACARLPAAAAAAAADLSQATLWQERYFWDGLIQARDRAARVSADPRLLEVVRTIAHQVAQQDANLRQIQSFVEGQLDNLKYAFSQQDPAPSLAIIRNNFHTLAQGAEQIRNNLYYLTTRVRMSSTQALPDPKLSEMVRLLIAQIQQVQLRLNTLYTDALAVEGEVQGETWAVDDFFRFSASHLLRMVIEVQDSIFAVYNASYELYILSKE